MKNNNILLESHFLLDIDAKSQTDAFEKIASLAQKLGCVENSDDLVEGFKNREKESTTGFEEGIAIPHARLKSIKKPAIIFARFNNPIDWKSIDQSLVKVAIALVIPEENSEVNYMDILSNVARKLLDKSFRDLIKTEKNIQTIIKNLLEEKEQIESKNTNKDGIKIVGITACATGVAHTYMARDALLEAANKLNWNVLIETQGQSGQEFALTDQQIANADAVILAADIAVDMSRFSGKKVYKVGTKTAMKDPVAELQRVIAKGKVLSSENGSTGTFDTSSKGIVKHIMSGVSYMIPFVVFAGIVFAIVSGISKMIWGTTYNLDGEYKNLAYSYTIRENVVVTVFGQQAQATYALQIIYKIASIGFTLMMPIMGGYIAYSVAGRAAIAPAMITTWVANDPNLWFKYGPFVKFGGDMKGLSIFGALIMGFACGYLIRWINSWKVNRYVKPIMPIIIIPLFVTIIIATFWAFVLGNLLGIAMGYFQIGLIKAESNTAAGVAIGLMLGLIAGVDMGGPINKIASFSATSIIMIDGGRAMGAAAASFAIAPLGAGVATLIFRKKFKEDQAMGINACILGTMGISEGAIPFAVKYTWAALIPNIICSGIAGGLAFLFQVSGWVGAWGGPIIALFGGVTTWGGSYLGVLWYFAAIAIAVAIHVILFRILVEFKTSSKENKWQNVKAIFTKKDMAKKHAKKSKKTAEVKAIK